MREKIFRCNDAPIPDRQKETANCPSEMSYPMILTRGHRRSPAAPDANKVATRSFQHPPPLLSEAPSEDFMALGNQTVSPYENFSRLLIPRAARRVLHHIHGRLFIAGRTSRSSMVKLEGRTRTGCRNSRFTAIHCLALSRKLRLHIFRGSSEQELTWCRSFFMNR